MNKAKGESDGELDMLILALDTSTQAATVAVAREEEILFEMTLNHKKTHSQKILPMIDRAMEDLELTVRDIDVFAVGTGPGSFTGLRIGVAMAKGFAHTLGKKLVGVSTLAMLAGNVSSFTGLIVPLMYARADEVFTGIYRDGNALEPDSVKTVGQALDHLELLDGDVLFVGDGVTRHRESIAGRLGQRARFAQPNNNNQRAATLAAAAYQKAARGEFDDCFLLAPSYLRVSQAEREFG